MSSVQDSVDTLVLVTLVLTVAFWGCAGLVVARWLGLPPRVGFLVGGLLPGIGVTGLAIVGGARSGRSGAGTVIAPGDVFGGAAGVDPFPRSPARPVTPSMPVPMPMPISGPLPPMPFARSTQPWAGYGRAEVAPGLPMPGFASVPTGGWPEPAPEPAPDTGSSRSTRRTGRPPLHLLLWGGGLLAAEVCGWAALVLPWWTVEVDQPQLGDERLAVGPQDTMWWSVPAGLALAAVAVVGLLGLRRLRSGLVLVPIGVGAALAEACTVAVLAGRLATRGSTLVDRVTMPLRSALPAHARFDMSTSIGPGCWTAVFSGVFLLLAGVVGLRFFHRALDGRRG